MKATKDFNIILNEGGVRVPYKEGDDKTNLKFIEVKKGGEIPDDFLKSIIETNIEIVDVEYKNKRPILPKELYNPPEKSKSMRINKRKYSQDGLNVTYNKEGFSALKKIGEEFGVTDRSARKLIGEILRAQEEKQRKGL